MQPEKSDSITKVSVAVKFTFSYLNPFYLTPAFYPTLNSNYSILHQLFSYLLFPCDVYNFLLHCGKHMHAFLPGKHIELYDALPLILIRSNLYKQKPKVRCRVGIPSGYQLSCCISLNHF